MLPAKPLPVVRPSRALIEAFLWPFRLTDHQDHVSIDFGWSPIPLYSFDAVKAEVLLVLYLTAITQRWQIGQRNADRMMANGGPASRSGFT